jgi:DinB superfamily
MPLSRSVLSRLLYQHNSISELISDLTEIQLKERLNPEKWSAFENVVHLAAYQPTFITRLGMMESGNEPLFQRYIADNDPIFHDYLKKPLSALQSDIIEKRSFINDQLSGLSEAQLDLKGVHPVYGSITIARWADFFLLHEAHHLWTIFQLTSQLRVSSQR